MAKFVPSTILRDNLFDTLNEVDKKEKYLVITKKGKPISAIVNLDFFEDLLALSSPKYLNAIKEARANYQKGEIFSHKEVFGL